MHSRTAQQRPIVILSHIVHLAVTEGFLPAAAKRGQPLVLITDQAQEHRRQLSRRKPANSQVRPVQQVAALAVGDLLVFPLAGAYAWNISHRDFLMHEPPQMLFLPSA